MARASFRLGGLCEASTDAASGLGITVRGKGNAMTVEKGRVVSIEYTLTLDSGTKVDSNVGGEPLKFTQGQSQILPALQEALVGLAVGDSKSVTLAPEEGYGPVHEEAFHEVEAQRIPPDARQVGIQLTAQDEQGNEHPIRVHEIRDDKVVLDFNHPLAGETLQFDVKILAVE